MKPVSTLPYRLRSIRNIIVLAFGLLLVGIGFWSVAFSTQGAWYTMTDFAGGLIMILLSLIWSLKYKRA